MKRGKIIQSGVWEALDENSLWKFRQKLHKDQSKENATHRWQSKKLYVLIRIDFCWLDPDTDPGGQNNPQKLKNNVWLQKRQDN